MDMRLLTSFLTVLRAGGITAAAAELGFVQSTVTTHIQALERLAGTPLLDRHPGGVSPTRAGSLLAEHAQRILDLEDRMLTELTTAAAEPAGPVRLCAPESVCAYRLAPFLPEVSKRFPGIGLSLFAAGTVTALTALADRRVDLALILGPPLHSPAVELADLGVQQLSLVAGAAATLPRHRPSAETRESPLSSPTAGRLLSIPGLDRVAWPPWRACGASSGGDRAPARSVVYSQHPPSCGPSPPCISLGSARVLPGRPRNPRIQGITPGPVPGAMPLAKRKSDS